MMIYIVMYNGVVEAVFDTYEVAQELVDTIKDEHAGMLEDAIANCYVDVNVVESSMDQIDR